MKESETTLFLSPLIYAYIGDAVYELYIRSKIISEYPNLTPNLYNKIVVNFVKAQNQALAIKKLFQELEEKEKRIVKSGRNSKPKTMPKNAKINDYKHATALEALIGYLYLERDFERLDYVLSRIYNIIRDEVNVKFNTVKQ